MLSRGKEEFREKKTKRTTSENPLKSCHDQKVDLPYYSSPIREEKVKEAKKKKRNGDYNSEEVYEKIADRLMDLFGIH